MSAASSRLLQVISTWVTKEIQKLTHHEKSRQQFYICFSLGWMSSNLDRHLSSVGHFNQSSHSQMKRLPLCRYELEMWWKMYTDIPSHRLTRVSMNFFQSIFLYKLTYRRFLHIRVGAIILFIFFIFHCSSHICGCQVLIPNPPPHTCSTFVCLCVSLAPTDQPHACCQTEIATSVCSASRVMCDNMWRVRLQGILGFH